MIEEKPNPGKQLIREAFGKKYKRIPVKTHVIQPGEDIVEIVKRYVDGFVKPGDIIMVGESAVAISQGRAVPIDSMKPGLLARILWRFVRKVPYGIGLRNPYSMQAAIDECGWFRILIASIIGGIGKLFGIRGLFYKIAGMQAALIDAPGTTPVKPYDRTVIKGPKDPDKVAQRIKEALGVEAVIMDVNDIGGSWVIGSSDGITKEMKKILEEVMRDNPCGQGLQLTPICIIREVKE